MLAGGIASIADHPPGKFKSRSSIHLPVKFFSDSFLRYFRFTIFWVREIDLGDNVSLASENGTQSCFYDCLIATLPFL